MQKAREQDVTQLNLLAGPYLDRGGGCGVCIPHQAINNVFDNYNFFLNFNLFDSNNFYVLSKHKSETVRTKCIIFGEGFSIRGKKLKTNFALKIVRKALNRLLQYVNLKNFPGKHSPASNLPKAVFVPRFAVIAEKNYA